MSAPRVAMLVANGVAGDSRVQKAAWSMAEAGWDVVLVGRAAGDRREEYALGRARVLLVPLEDELSGYQKVRPRRSEAVRRRAAYRAARARTARWDAADSGGPAVRAAAAARGRLERWPAGDALVGRLGSGRVGGPAALAAGAVRGLADRNGGWRSFNPWFRDLELAFAPVLAELRPDLIHAHDFHMVGIGARAAGRLGVPWVYDAHEYLAGIDVPGRWYRRSELRGLLRRRMLVGVEREYIGRADAVVTVSRGIAERLRADHGLAAEPLVIANAPMRHGGAEAAPQQESTAGEGAAGAAVSLREAVGLGPETPLLVYSGGMAPRRGVASVVEGLARLERAHLALVAREDDPDVPALLTLAERLGVAGRVHTAPYVSPDRVVEYIASADAGLIPILHRPNHELSLITKYLEYLHAGLPIVCSDVRTMARTTEELGVGEVYPAGDPAGFAEAAGRVLDGIERYRAQYLPGRPGAAAAEEYRWSRQAEALDALYARLLGRRPELTDGEQGLPAGGLTLCPVGSAG
ncbi:glycosyltransferase [Phaeacidiphilus oryzae]|uniref:glycosyltransferase n=1 Tax=Phaeacidiphilus oryzae TaxID=348818 RepID=UPI00068B09EA|nr:glycosyltransferase [Phaeacidiphilus oryzae]